MTLLKTKSELSGLQTGGALHKRATTSPTIGAMSANKTYLRPLASPKQITPTHMQDRPQYASLQALFETAAFEQRFAPESTIILHEAPAKAIYRVVSGTVRCCTIDVDGGRQIFSFAKKGDFIGISDIDTSHFTAEAVDCVILKTISRIVLEQTLAVSIDLRQDIRGLMHNQLVNREKQLLSLISHKAPERLLAFLQDFAASRPASGFVALPMSRRDIGDHLGMTTETVSRAFGALKTRGAIEMAHADKYRIVGAGGA